MSPAEMSAAVAKEIGEAKARGLDQFLRGLTFDDKDIADVVIMAPPTPWPYPERIVFRKEIVGRIDLTYDPPMWTLTFAPEGYGEPLTVTKSS